jgi:hypothetical protein
MTLIRKQFSVYNPETKRPLLKNISGESIEEIEKKGAEWKEQMKKEIQAKKEAVAKQKEEIPPTVKQDMFETKPFKLVMPDDTFSLMAIGSTRSGKSTAVKYIMENYAGDHISICFTPSVHAGVYKDFPKKTMFSPMYFPEVVKDMYTINSKTKNHYPFMCVLDDVVDKKNDKELMKLLTIYRNSRISCLMCSQSKAIMNATARTNLNFVCCFKMNNDEEIEKVIKGFLISRFPAEMKMPDKIRLYREATNDHRFFFIDNFTGEVCLTKISL